MPGLGYVQVAEMHLGKRFIPVTPVEYRSPDGCPQCGGGDDSDRLRLFLAGNSNPRVWCRRCGYLLYLDTLDAHNKLSEEEIERFKQELQKRREDEKKKQEDAIKKINASIDHLKYFNNMGNHLEAIEYWYGEGVNSESVNKYKLGYCDSCPTAPYSASYTIPVTRNGKLYNIRHRLVTPNGHGKYRPHMSGLPIMLFNADDLDVESKFGFVLEGEKKTIVIRQKTGIPSVGIMGMSSFSSGWVRSFGNWEQVYVCLDPDADKRAMEIVKLFNGRGRMVTLPVKADDFFVKYNGTVSDFEKFVGMAA